MALVKTALPATLPATQRKTLANANVGTLMGAGIFRQTVTADSLIAPRVLVATPTLAMTGLGVGASPLSIVQGLITLAVRHAHGNAIDGIENLPAAAEQYPLQPRSLSLFHLNVNGWEKIKRLVGRGDKPSVGEPRSADRSDSPGQFR